MAIGDYYASIETSCPNFGVGRIAKVLFSKTQNICFSFWYIRISQSMCRFRCRQNEIRVEWQEALRIIKGEDQTRNWVFLKKQITEK